MVLWRLGRNDGCHSTGRRPRSGRLSPRLRLPKVLEGDSARRFITALRELIANPPLVTAIEGKQRDSRARERSGSLRAKKLLLHNSVCDACRRDYGSVAGSRGLAALEVHHRTPVSTAGDGSLTTTLADLAVVCASCHRMLHAEGPDVPPVSPEDLFEHLGTS